MIPATFLRKQYRQMPDRVTVGYKVQTSLGTYASPADITDSWWRPGATGELGPSDGVAVRSLRTWYFPKAVTSIVPAIGDVLVSPVSAIDPVSVSWTILGLQDAGALGAWQLEAISLQLQSNLRGSITFSRPDNTQDSAGRPNPSYSAFASAIPCRVQPEDGDATEVYERITIPRRFTCFLGTRTAVRAKDKATDDAGTVYTVVSSEMPERLDELQRVTLEQVL